MDFDTPSLVAMSGIEHPGSPELDRLSVEIVLCIGTLSPLRRRQAPQPVGHGVAADAEVITELRERHAGFLAEAARFGAAGIVHVDTLLRAYDSPLRCSSE